jgi:hypothetical protein
VSRRDADTHDDYDASEDLWAVCRPGVGDVMVTWEELTIDEQQAAIRHHNKLYGIET